MPMQTLLNSSSIDPAAFDKFDKWEIGYFDVDPRGQKLYEPLLGVRVNEGTWITAEALTEAIAKEKSDRLLKAIFGEEDDDGNH